MFLTGSIASAADATAAATAAVTAAADATAATAIASTTAAVTAAVTTASASTTFLWCRRRHLVLLVLLLVLLHKPLRVLALRLQRRRRLQHRALGGRLWSWHHVTCAFEQRKQMCECMIQGL